MQGWLAISHDFKHDRDLASSSIFSLHTTAPIRMLACPGVFQSLDLSQIRSQRSISNEIAGDTPGEPSRGGAPPLTLLT